jgi:hypothetical protein
MAEHQAVREPRARTRNGWNATATIAVATTCNPSCGLSPRPDQLPDAHDDRHVHHRDEPRQHRDTSDREITTSMSYRR